MRIPIQSLFTLLTIELGLPTFRSQFHFCVNVHHFVYHLRLLAVFLPQFTHSFLAQSTSQPVPSSAVLLWSCMNRFRIFLNRTRQACERHLAFTDHFVPFMCADFMLVSSYYSHAGRVVEAHSTIGLTVHLWLHVGDAMEVVQTRDTNSLVLLPADPIDGGERVNIR